MQNGGGPFPDRNKALRERMKRPAAVRVGCYGHNVGALALTLPTPLVGSTTRNAGELPFMRSRRLLLPCILHTNENIPEMFSLIHASLLTKICFTIGGGFMAHRMLIKLMPLISNKMCMFHASLIEN